MKNRSDLFFPNWALSIAVLLAIGAALGWFGYDEYSQTIEREFRALESNNRIAEAQVTNLLRNVEQLLSGITREQKTLTPARRARYGAVLTERMSQFPEIRSLVVIDAEGRVELSANPDLIGFDSSKRDYFVAHVAKPLEPSFYVSRPFKTATGGDMSIAFSAALYDDDGNFRGVVVAGMNPKYFESVLSQIRPAGKHTGAALFNQHGDLIYRLPDPEKYAQASVAGGARFNEHVSANRPRTRHIGVSANDGTTRISVFSRIGSSGLSVGVSQLLDDVLADWRKNMVIRALVFVLTAVVIVGFARIAQRRQGERARAETALRESEERFRLLTEQSPFGMMLVAADGRYEFVNPAFSKITGYAAADVPDGRTWFSKAYPDVDYRREVIRVWEEDLAKTQQGESRPREYVVTCKDGSRKSIGFRPVMAADQRQIVLLEDLSERKQAEQALRESEARFRLLIEKSLAGMYVSRDIRFLYANPRLEEILGYGPGELVGLRGDALVVPEDLPVMKAARDQLKAGASSVAYTVRAQRKDGAIIELGVQGVLANFEGEPATIGMAQDIGERSRAQAEIKHYIARLERTTQGTLEAVALMVEQRDPYTAGHERRVGELAAAIGAEMGLSEDTVQGLRLAGYVHDVGKISVPAELLSKPTRLTPLEFQLIKGHSQNGYDVLKNVDFPWPVAEVILQHHERLDGSGYPRQLKGEQIIIEARIMSVADVVEAMSSHRPYRPGLGIEAALAEIEKNSGTLYDPLAVAACLRLFRNKDFALPE